VKGATQEREVTLVFESASTHAMIAVKDLGRAKEFYSGMLGLTASDERHGAGIRYETTWYLVTNLPAPAAPARPTALTRPPAWPRSCASTRSATGSSRAASRSGTN
jgi:catechol 2,3-dioxygenase-like lactoylglutathione lyase family enzyme